MPTTAATATDQSIVDNPVCDSDELQVQPADGDDVVQKSQRAAYGTAGTWLGRRPPKKPEKLAVFLAKKALWEEERNKDKLAKEDAKEDAKDDTKDDT